MAAICRSARRRCGSSVVARVTLFGVVINAAAVAGWAARVPTSGVIQRYVTEWPDGEPAQKMIQTTWYKNGKVRQETTSPHGIMIEMASPGGHFTILPGAKEAIRELADTPSGKTVVTNPFGEIEFVERHGKRMGSERVGRYRTDVYEQITEWNQPGPQRGRVLIRRWISPNAPVPIKIIQQMPGLRTVMVLKSARLTAQIPDALFQLPRGMKVRDRKP